MHPNHTARRAAITPQKKPPSISASLQPACSSHANLRARKTSSWAAPGAVAHFGTFLHIASSLDRPHTRHTIQSDTLCHYPDPSSWCPASQFNTCETALGCILRVIAPTPHKQTHFRPMRTVYPVVQATSSLHPLHIRGLTTHSCGPSEPRHPKSSVPAATSSLPLLLFSLSYQRFTVHCYTRRPCPLFIL